MDNRGKKQTSASLHGKQRSVGRKGSKSNKSDTSGIKAASLYDGGSSGEEGQNHRISKSGNLRAVAGEDARLTDLENTLVNVVNVPDTPFQHIRAISNPGTGEIMAYPALQFWYESHRTTDRKAVNQVLVLTQEVLFGSNIISNRSVESDARRECYGLQEELESKIIGLMPSITNDINVIFPIYDVDSAFTSISESGLFILTTYYILTWDVAKGAKNG